MGGGTNLRRMSAYSPDELSFSDEICRCGSRCSFKIKNGKLLLQCQKKQNKCQDVLWCGNDNIYFSEFVCPRCNITTSLKLSRTPKNPGKLFYTCPICNEFKWWQRSLRTMSNENDGVLNDGASSSASASTPSTPSTSSFTVVGEVLTTLGDMMKRLGMEEK